MNRERTSHERKPGADAGTGHHIQIWLSS